MKQFDIYLAGGAKAIERLVGEHFPEGATILQGVGFWKRISERCHVVRVVGAQGAYVREFARVARAALDQTMILVIETAVVNQWEIRGSD